MNKLYEKYCNGDSLTDEEVTEGEIFFRELAGMLYDAGLAFYITAKEANRVYLGLRGYREARKLSPAKVKK